MTLQKKLNKLVQTVKIDDKEAVLSIQRVLGMWKITWLHGETEAYCFTGKTILEALYKVPPELREAL